MLLTDDFTRLTLDAIALCTMDFRFNSFYSERMHPFIDAMLEFLVLSGNRGTRPPVLNKIIGSSEVEEIKKCQEVMNGIGQQIITDRRANPVEGEDMLNTLMYGVDKKGNIMRDELIAAQMVTFLIAGMFQIRMQCPYTTLLMSRRTRDNKWCIVISIRTIDAKPSNLPPST